MRGTLQAFLDKYDGVYQVVLTQVKGSSPREEGATIFVAEDAIWGTIGGGQLEYLAIDEARRMHRKTITCREMSVPLGPEIGQCCGGVVTLSFSRLNEQAKKMALQVEAQEQASQPSVYILGAGHVGRALCSALALLPVRPIVIDSRADELALVKGNVEQRYSPLPESEIRRADAGSVFIVLTHDHALDFLLTHEALLRGDAAYVGMIGSKSKRATFSHWFKNELTTQQDLNRAADMLLQDLICPIGGGGSGDKRPAVVAAMVAAEVMTALDCASLQDSAVSVIDNEPRPRSKD